MRKSGLTVTLLFCCLGLGTPSPAQQTNADLTNIAEIRANVIKGDAKAELLLGFLYSQGKGVTKDSAEALKWYRKSAEQNFAPAQYAMGTCYANGEGLARNEAEATKWYLKAAGQNLAVAQYNLGVCYRDGQGVTKDEEEAAIWFRKAADQNLAVAQYNLGVCYDNGQGVPKDYSKALKWYRKAADSNLAYAQCNLGAHYEQGAGVPKDGAEAAQWYRKAAEQDYALAQYNLGACYATGTGVAKDDAEAVKWYRRAASQDLAVAQCNLGVCYANGQGVPKDDVQAAECFRRAAEQNDSEAQYNLGSFYYNGQGVRQNDAEAYIWFSLSAAQGNADASHARDTTASRLSRAAAAEAQRRISAFSPRKRNMEQPGSIFIGPTSFSDQLGFSPAPQQADANTTTPIPESRPKNPHTETTPDQAPAQPSPPKTNTTTPRIAITRDYFTVGSTRDEVLAIQGEPTRFSDTYLMYGFSMVMFRDGKVDNWTSTDVKLKATYLTASNLVPKEYFTVGSTRDEVLAIHGEPTRFGDNYLMYGFSMVMFRDGKVDYWNNADIKLKAQYTTPQNPLQKQYPTESNAPTPQPLPLAEPSPVLPQTSKQPDRDAENATLKPTPMPVITVQAPEQPQVNGIAYMDNFLGEKNFCIPSDNIINMKTDALKFQINGTTYNYSGHYAVMLITPRKHRAPLLGFGTPEKAKLIIINNFGGDAIPLPNATVWEKSNGFIDVEALAAC